MSFNGMGKFNPKPGHSYMDTRRFFDGPGCYTWKKVFHVFPVKTISGKWVWCKYVYEQRFWTDWGSGFHLEPTVEYAELFDLLQE
jgi:hypothetical protein